jgi:hypothetical protein
MLLVRGSARRRLASTSVHRSLPLVVASWPSVIESPRATMAAASGWAATLFPKDLLMPDFIRDDKDIVAFKGLAMIELRMSCRRLDMCSLAEGLF